MQSRYKAGVTLLEFECDKIFDRVEHNSTNVIYSLRVCDVNLCIALAFTGRYEPGLILMDWKSSWLMENQSLILFIPRKLGLFI